jgi:hypothetical protein
MNIFAWLREEGVQAGGVAPGKRWDSVLATLFCVETGEATVQRVRLPYVARQGRRIVPAFFAGPGEYFRGGPTERDQQKREQSLRWMTDIVSYTQSSYGQAVLDFILRNPLPALLGKTTQVAFRVQGRLLMDVSELVDFWEQLPDDQKEWKEPSAQSSPIRTCVLCGNLGRIARIHDPLFHGGPVLISVNRDFTAAQYGGREQGEVAQFCYACMRLYTRGFTHILLTRQGILREDLVVVPLHGGALIVTWICKRASIYGFVSDVGEAHWPMLRRVFWSLERKGEKVVRNLVPRMVYDVIRGVAQSRYDLIFPWMADRKPGPSLWDLAVSDPLYSCVRAVEGEK